MAVTANQLAVALFDAAAGGYKGLIEATQLKNGDVYAANWLLVESGLNNPDTDIFAYVLVDKLVGNTLTSAQKAAGAAEIKYILATNGNSRGDAVLKAINFLSTTTDATYANAKNQFLNKVTTADSYTGSSTNLADLKNVVANVTSVPSTVNPGQTFTLTTAIGENVTGTTGNDTFSAVLDGAAGATGTLNTGDAISGGTGTDTLNVLVTAASTPAVGNVIKDVEVINFTHVGASGALALSSANYSGVTQLWQIDNTNAAGNFQNVVVGADVVAGFKSTGAAATATLLQTAVPANVAVDGTAASQTSVKVALDGVLGGAGSGLTFGATTGAFATITVTGSTVAATAAGNTLALVDDTGTKTLNLGLTSATTVNVTDADNSITKVDLSTSTGNVTVGTNLGAGITGVKTVIGGTGNDTFTVDMGTAVAGMSVDLGAGNDTLNLDATGTTGDTNGTVTLGAGKDTVLTAATISNIVTAGGGVTAATADELVANIVTITDFKTSEDVLDLTTGTALTAGQLATINGSASLLAATQAAAAVLNGVAGQVVFSYGGDAYVFNEVGVAGVNNGDGLIKLTGVDATLFTNVQNGNLVL